MSCPCLLDEVQENETGISIMEFDSVFIGPLVGVAPSLAFWIAVIVLAAIMLQRSANRAERFLVAGAGLKLLSNLLSIPAVAIVPWLIGRGYSIDYANSVVTGYGIFCKIVGMTGIICLLYAFWIKYKAWNLERSLPQQL